VVETIRVCQEISVGSQLSQNWAIGEDFLLHSLEFLGEAVVNDFIEVIGLSANVFSEMLLGTFALFSS